MGWRRTGWGRGGTQLRKGGTLLREGGTQLREGGTFLREGGDAAEGSSLLGGKWAMPRSGGRPRFP